MESLKVINTIIICNKFHYKGLTNKTKLSLSLLTNIFGRDIVKHVVLCITNWDKEEKAKFYRKRESLPSKRIFSKIIIDSLMKDFNI
jgi:hypothetical protein